MDQELEKCVSYEDSITFSGAFRKLIWKLPLASMSASVSNSVKLLVDLRINSVYMTLGPHTGGHEEFYLLGYNAV
jgi:hypothetical protein